MEKLEQRIGQGILTKLGFRDVSIPLETKILEELRKYDVIKNIRINKEKEELHKGKTEKIYYFYSREYNMRGRIFPSDEIVTIYQTCDIIIQNWKPEINLLNVDSQIYHDLEKGEKLKVRVSKKIYGKDPSFVLFNSERGNTVGYVSDYENKKLYKEIAVGSKILVEIIHLHKKYGKFYIFVKALKNLEDAT